MSTTQVPPIQYPRVTVAGITLTVKFNFQAEYLLSKWGISMLEFQDIMRQSRADAKENPKGQIHPRMISMITDVFAACVAHNYIALGQDPPDPMWWAEKMDFASFKDIMNAVFESMGKATPAAPQPETPLATTPAVQ